MKRWHCKSYFLLADAAKKHSLHLATEHFHFATLSSVLGDITANGATDTTREKNSKSVKPSLNNKSFSSGRHHHKWCYRD